MTASPYDLTTLAAVKAWLGTPDSNIASDAVLAPLISAASRWLLGYLSRGNILSAAYADRFDGTGWGQSSLLLPRWPVTSIASLLVNGQAIPAGVVPSATAPVPSGWLLEPWDGIPAGAPQKIDLFGYGFARGRQNISVAYTAGYLVSAEAATVPATPYKVTTAQLFGAWAADSGVVYASSGVALTKVATGTPTIGQYKLDTVAGVYQFAAADAAAAVLISYSYVPFDLAQACIEIVGERFSYKGRIGMVSKTLGGQETITFSLKDVPDAVKSMLMNYRNVVPF